MIEETIKKSELLQYSFYDEQHKLITVLNEEALKRFFKADVILLNEYEHK